MNPRSRSLLPSGKMVLEMLLIPGILAVCLLVFIQCRPSTPSSQYAEATDKANSYTVPVELEEDTVALDTSLFNQQLLHLVHHQPDDRWPVQTDYPLPGALLPFYRIVAYYGNLYSRGMGILGALPPAQMKARLLEEVEKWERADSLTPVIPALHYIAVTAQRDSGVGNTYRLRMPFGQIDKVLAMADEMDGIVFLDLQIGHSTLQKEIPLLKKYLALPRVHLGIDPEYSMKGGHVPGTKIGTLDADDINYASDYLAKLVREYSLPPKILVVHRFTNNMVTRYKKIMTRPEVQIVMHMDGFGYPAKKVDTYKRCIVSEPVQFTGFKIFYKNDAADPRWPVVMQPEEILKLYPKPSYIQYQ